MWSASGLERLRDAVRARLRAVLEADCPPLEPWVRTVLEQRLDSAVLDLMELVRGGEETVENVKKEPQVKQEPETPDLNIVCVKVEQEEQEIQFKPEPPSDRTQDLHEDRKPDFHHAETFLYCPQCGSTLEAQALQRPPSLPPGQPQCSYCGQSAGRDSLLLDHDYTQDLQSIQEELQRGAAGFRCSVCGQDFIQVGALLEHMSLHLSVSSPVSPEFYSTADEAWSFEDDAFDGAPQETICSVCGGAFTDSAQLQEHLRTHLR